MGRIIQSLTDEELEEHYKHLLEDEVLQYGVPQNRELWEKLVSETKAEIYRREQIKRNFYAC